MPCYGHFFSTYGHDLYFDENKSLVNPKVSCAIRIITLCLTDRTPLLHALFGENVVTFKYLLDHGANQDKVNIDGFTPLHSAAGFGPSL